MYPTPGQDLRSINALVRRAIIVSFVLALLLAVFGGGR